MTGKINTLPHINIRSIVSKYQQKTKKLKNSSADNSFLEVLIIPPPQPNKFPFFDEPTLKVCQVKNCMWIFFGKRSFV